MDKRFVSAEELLLDSYRLAVKIHADGFRPDFIVGLWRGGSPVGIAVQECLEHLGVETDHISVRTSYRGMTEYARSVEGGAAPRVHGLQYLLENLEAEHALLIVDDVYGSGRSTQAVVDRLADKIRRNMPEDVRVAAPWYRPTSGAGEASTGRANGRGAAPDYFVNETRDWLVLPYELTGLTRDEIAAHKPTVARILERLDAKR